MSIWEDFSIEARVRDILDIPPREPGHHFGRPFLTAYQIAISFADRFPDEHDLIGKQIGGRGTGPSHSLAQYLARELSDRIKKGRLTGVDGADLHGTYVDAPFWCKQNFNNSWHAVRHCRMSGLQCGLHAPRPVWCSWIGSKSLRRYA